MRYRKWVIVAIVLFSGGILLGLVTPADIASPFAEDLIEQLSGLLSEYPLLTLLLILANNIFALVFSFVLSPILCLTPLMALLLNGWLLGFISLSVVSERSLGFLIAGILPHGVFELPALIIAEAAAFSFGFMVIMLLIHRESRKTLWRTATMNLERKFLSVIMVIFVGFFHTVLITALMEETTRKTVLVNLKQNVKYLVIAIALMVPAAVIEIFVTPLLLA
jgi:stage II sporulation protein M